MEFYIEIRPLTELQREDRGIEGTDQVIAVALGGFIVGYCDDYGTFTPFERDEVSGSLDKEAIESLVAVACHVWAEATS